MALSCVYRRRASASASATSSTCCAAPRARRSCARGHDRLSTYGIGAELSRDHWQSLIRQLIHRGYLRAGHRPLLGAAAHRRRSRPLLRGEETLVLAKPRDARPDQEAAPAHGAGRPGRRARRPAGRRSALRGAARAAQAPRRRAERAGLRRVQRRHPRRDGRAPAGDVRRTARRQRGRRRPSSSATATPSSRRSPSAPPAARPPARSSDVRGDRVGSQPPSASAYQRRGTARAGSRPCSRARAGRSGWRAAPGRSAA